MKNFFLILLLSSFVVGCHSYYDVTLSNGTQINRVTRPVLDKNAGVYRFKTVTGKEQQVPAMKVIAINAK